MMDVDRLEPCAEPVGARNSPWRKRDVAFALSLYFAAQIAGAVIVLLAGNISQEASTLLSLAVSVLGSVVSVGVLMLVRRLRPADIDLGGLPQSWLLKCLLWGLGLLMARVVMAAGLVALLPWLEIGSDLLEQALVPESFGGKLAVIALGGLMAPVGEELLFRGLFFGALRRKGTFWSAALISSLVFGMFHVIPLQIITAAVLGIALCWVYERSHSLTVPIVVHIINNVIALALSFASIPFVN